MTVFVIDSAGNVELAPPGPPVNLQVFPNLTGKALVMMRYNQAADGANPADTWEIFATEGADPDPDVDVPAHTSSILNFGGSSYIGQVIGDYTPGATLHVIGSVFRTSDGKRGVTEVVTLDLPLAPSIEEDDAMNFGGTVHENR